MTTAPAPATRSTASRPASSPPAAERGGVEPEHHRFVVVGTGFAGIAMAARLLEAGHDDVVLLERADGPGGTWRDNTYPGCQCDVPSNLYSLSFAPNPDWTTTFPLQPELHRYLTDVADRFGVSPRVRWRTPMLDASWDDEPRRWRVETPSGPLTAEHLVLAVGALAEPSTPDLPGLDEYQGTTFHTARWDHDHDLAGRRVAVVGTGASAIQVVPAIAPEVDHLDLYQRTPAWVMPHKDRPVRRWERRLYRALPWLQRLRRGLTYAALEARILAFTRRPQLMRAAEKVGRDHIRRHIADPDLADRLTPRYELGCKRALLSDDYYPALARPNVDVVTGGVERLTRTGVVTADGVERPADTIVFATGFHVTDSPSFRLVHGRGGQELLAAFEQRGAYNGTTCHGFPNLWVMAGPNTGIGHTSLVYMIESQVAYVLDAVRRLDQAGAATAEVRADVQDAWFAEVQAASEGTVWASGCQSWYLDRHGRNGAIWPGPTFSFRRRTRRFDLERYETTPAREHAVR